MSPSPTRSQNCPQSPAKPARLCFKPRVEEKCAGRCAGTARSIHTRTPPSPLPLQPAQLGAPACTLRAMTKGTGFSQQHLLKSKAPEEMSGAALINAQEFFRQ